MRQVELPQVNGRFLGRLLTVALLLAGLLPVAFAQPIPPTGGHGAPKGKKPAPKTEVKKTVPAPKPADVAIDPKTGLPKDYKVPPEKPDVLTTHEPLVTPEELVDLKKALNPYKKALNATGPLTEEQKAAIRKGIKYRLALLCEKDNIQVLHTKREDLTIRDLQLAGKLQAAADVRNFRRFILTEIVKQAEPLLQKNELVRIHAATMIGELDLTETDVQRSLKQEAFADGIPVLTKVLVDSQQPEAVKIAAARSIVRLLRFGVPTVPIKHEIANAIVAELRDAKKFFWYQLRLVEALALLDTVLDLQNRKPFIVDTLRMVMNDPERDWQVRSMAARGLGRVPYDPSVPLATVMQEIATFARDMSKTAQQQPKNPIWKTNFWWLYLAFQAHDGTDLEATKRGRGGLKNNVATAAICEPVYQLILPITNKLLADQPVTVQHVQALDEWLQKTKPVATQPGIAEGKKAPGVNTGTNGAQ